MPVHRVRHITITLLPFSYSDFFYIDLAATGEENKHYDESANRKVQRVNNSVRERRFQNWKQPIADSRRDEARAKDANNIHCLLCWFARLYNGEGDIYSFGITAVKQSRQNHILMDRC